MTSKTTAEERHEMQRLFNDLIKKSDYLNSTIDSFRLATSQSIAILLKALLKHDPSLFVIVCEALAEIETKTWISPSIDGDRSLLARSLRKQINVGMQASST
ncbi:hypothetical protein ACO0LM_10430 [Undibacterium sp. Di26W]|uniref:hypothetical protein n=1 Tax=Undibacterium sp. Di26W TaxID=3413035 RepID=UPI003BF02E1B